MPRRARLLLIAPQLASIRHSRIVQGRMVAMSEKQAIPAIDAWAQPVTGRTRQDLPEVVRLLEKSGTARYLDRQLTPAEIVAIMDAAGIQQLMLSAWCRPGRWLISNDEVAAHVAA